MMAAAIVIGGTLVVTGQHVWGMWITIVLVGLVATYVSYEIHSKLRVHVSEQVSELQNHVKLTTISATVDNLAMNGIQARFPGIQMPVSTWSMMPSNLQAVLDYLDRHKPGLVVELGSGISTLVTAAWFRERGQGRVFSFDHDPTWADMCRFYLEQHGLGDWANVRDAPLTDHTVPGERLPWYGLGEQLDDLHDIGLLVVDGPPAGSRELQLSRMPALPRFHERLAPTAAVFVDDGEREGESAIVRQWQEQFPEFNARYFATTTGLWMLTREKSGA